MCQPGLVELYIGTISLSSNILSHEENGQHVTDDILKCIFLDKNIDILIQISLNLILNG